MEVKSLGFCLARAILRGHPISQIRVWLSHINDRRLLYNIVQAASLILAKSSCLPSVDYCRRLCELLASHTDSEDCHEILYEVAARAPGTLAPSCNGQSAPGLPAPHGYLSYFSSNEPSFQWTVRASSTFSDVPLAVWPASYTLIDACAALARLQPRLWQERNILELGAGTGLAALVLCRGGLFSNHSDDSMQPAVPASYTATDGVQASVDFISEAVQAHDSVAAQRGLASSPADVPVCAAPFDWMGDPLEPSRLSLLQSHDVLVSSDIVYDPTCMPALAECIAQFLSYGRSVFPPQRPAAATVVVDTHSGEELSPQTLLQTLATPPVDGQSRTRFGVLATTYRNPTTYSLLQSCLVQQGVLYLEGLGQLLKDGSHIVPVLQLELPVLGEQHSESSETGALHDVRVALLVHESCLSSLGAELAQ